VAHSNHITITPAITLRLPLFAAVGRMRLLDRMLASAHGPHFGNQGGADVFFRNIRLLSASNHGNAARCQFDRCA
jgi:hypothetical protein